MLHEYIAQVSERIFAPASKVWEALVTPSIEMDGNTYEDRGTILAIEPGAMLKYSYWSSLSGIEDKPENYVDITYEVKEHEGKTMITISQENIPSEKMKYHAIETWTKVLKNLKELLEEEN